MQRNTYIISSVLCFLIAIILFSKTDQLQNEYFHMQQDAYINKLPENGIITIRVNVNSIISDEYGNIGSSLKYEYKINDIEICDSATIDIAIDEPINISTKITEIDSIPDIGTDVYHMKPHKIADYIPQLIETRYIRVNESGGRSNSGSYAIFKVTYSLSRVIPDDVNILEIDPITPSAKKLISKKKMLDLASFIILTVGFIFFIAFFIQKRGKSNEAKSNSSKKVIDRGKNLDISNGKDAIFDNTIDFSQKRKECIEKYRIHSLHEWTGAPNDIHFTQNGKIYKGIYSEKYPYGELTVFVSSTGNRFHKKYVCGTGVACEAFCIYDVWQYGYSPCQRCAKNIVYSKVPEWYLIWEKILCDINGCHVSIVEIWPNTE